MKIINILIVVFCLLLLNFPTHVQAGDSGGPYVIWVNLSRNIAIEKEIMKRMKESDDLDFENGIFFFKKRPSGITNELVYKAVIKNDKAAIKLLVKKISQPFEDFDKGFDGIIAYDEENGPRLSVILRNSRDVYREIVSSPKDPESVWKTFSSIIPEVTRKP